MTAGAPRGARLGVLAAALVAASAACTPAADDAPAPVGPASAYLAYVEALGEDEFRAQAREAEDLVAACMAQEGFAYAPDVGVYGFVEAATAELVAEPGTREFAQEYGFVLGDEEAEGGVHVPPDDGPNAERLAAMSPEELAAYDEALYGTWALEPPSDPLTETDWDAGGCRARAERQAFRRDAVGDPVFGDLQEELHRIRSEAVPRDPRVAELDVAWGECMSEAGHPGLAGRAAVLQEWRDRLSAGGAVGADGMVEGYAELVEQERAQAVADAGCRRRTDYDDVVAAVQAEHEQEYVDAHRSELDAWVERWDLAAEG